MSRGAVRGLTLTGSGLGKAAVRGLTITGTAGGARAAVHGLTITGNSVTGPSRAAVYGLTITGGPLGSLLMDAGGGQVVVPLDIVWLDARGSTGPPETVLWDQIDSTGVTVPINNADQLLAWIVAPAALSGGVALSPDLIFRVTGTKGAATDIDQATVSVRPQQIWDRNEADTAWVPTQRYIIT
jgi:hypothetical protein